MRKSNIWLVSEGGYSCIISWWDRICWTALSSCLGVAARASVWPEYCLTDALGCMSSIQAGWSEEGMETFHTWRLVCKWLVDYSGTYPFCSIFFFSISSWLNHPYRAHFHQGQCHYVLFFMQTRVNYHHLALLKATLSLFGVLIYQWTYEMVLVLEGAVLSDGCLL